MALRGKCPEDVTSQNTSRREVHERCNVRTPHGDCSSRCDQSSRDESRAPKPGARDRRPRKSQMGPASKPRPRFTLSPSLLQGREKRGWNGLGLSNPQWVRIRVERSEMKNAYTRWASFISGVPTGIRHYPGRPVRRSIPQGFFNSHKDLRRLRDGYRKSSPLSSICGEIGTPGTMSSPRPPPKGARPITFTNRRIASPNSPTKKRIEPMGGHIAGFHPFWMGPQKAPRTSKKPHPTAATNG